MSSNEVPKLNQVPIRVHESHEFSEYFEYFSACVQPLESSPSLTSISSSVASPLSDSSSSLSSSNNSLTVMVKSNEYRKRVTSDSYMELKRANRTRNSICSGNRTSDSNSSNIEHRTIHSHHQHVQHQSPSLSTPVSMNSEDESEAENEALENGVDNDLQTLSIVASGLFFCHTV